ncbi:MAG: hypothetical protein ABIG60_01690 [Patescibacteria group bacterium]
MPTKEFITFEGKEKDTDRFILKVPDTQLTKVLNWLFENSMVHNFRITLYFDGAFHYATGRKIYYISYFPTNFSPKHLITELKNFCDSEDNLAPSSRYDSRQPFTIPVNLDI